MIHKALERQIYGHIIDLIKGKEEIEEMKHIINNILDEKISIRKLCKNEIKELIENNINFVYHQK